jgi:hypothetical protein
MAPSDRFFISLIDGSGLIANLLELLGHFCVLVFGKVSLTSHIDAYPIFRLKRRARMQNNAAKPAQNAISKVSAILCRFPTCLMLSISSTEFGY